MIPGSAPQRVPDLQKQYELVLQEYRFQVHLNWDRAKHFLIFNTAILTAAVALYKNGGTAVAKFGVAGLLFLAAYNSFVGRHSIGEGHEMYRAIRRVKTALEQELGLEEFAIKSTAGMKREHGDVPEGTGQTGRARASSITNQMRLFLLIIGLLSASGAIYAAYEAISTL